MRKKLFLPLLLILFFILPISTYAEGVTVVIDPGHGGNNLGGQYGDYVEKEMTMQTANAMKNRLELFENIEVYLTHDNTTDPDMSLTKRAQTAANLHADFMISLHYNKSIDNRLYGSEVWVSAFGDYYSKGASFGNIEMQMLTDLGLFDRGIKTRLNKKGTDYYGIIQHAKDFDIPCVIIEHCHMDQPNDIQYLERENPYTMFGELDAEAVAKYFKLKSDVLSEDYTNYECLSVPIPDSVVKPDTSRPDKAEITIHTEEEDSLTVQISAFDSDSAIQYYDYSLDNGLTYCDLQPWPKEKSECIFSVPKSEYAEQNLLCRVYNKFDLSCESNTLLIPQSEIMNKDTDSKRNQESIIESDTTEEREEVPIITYHVDEKKTARDTLDIVLLTFMVFTFIFLVFTIFFFFYVIKKKRRRKRYRVKR